MRRDPLLSVISTLAKPRPIQGTNQTFDGGLERTLPKSIVYNGLTQRQEHTVRGSVQPVLWTRTAILP